MNWVQRAACRIILAIEDSCLRSRLLQALERLQVRPETLSPDELLQTELAGYVLIFLETSDDVARLVQTARQVYETWGEPGRAALQFLAYASADVMTDEVIFDLWRIGPEMTVIVHNYRPDELSERMQEAICITQRVVEAASQRPSQDR